MVDIITPPSSPTTFAVHDYRLPLPPSSPLPLAQPPTEGSAGMPGMQAKGSTVSRLQYRRQGPPAAAINPGVRRDDQAVPQDEQPLVIKQGDPHENHRIVQSAANTASDIFRGLQRFADDCSSWAMQALQIISTPR